jgi:lysophospholipase L1-like esterase
MGKNILLKLVLAIFVVVQFTSCSSIPKSGEDLSGIIDADNPNIQYYGRFDFSNPKKVVFDWPGVRISAKFEGTSCIVRLNDESNEYSVVVDNYAPRLLIKDSNNQFIAAKGLTETIPHKITIHKRTESLFGKGEFEGLILDKGKKLLVPDKRPERRIEFIGNSITCGYGVEADSSDCHFSAGTENANLSYASIASRELNADYSLIAYSGRGVVRNYGDSNKTSVDPMPALYDRICFNDSSSKWNFSKWIPQAVVINLGTNDFSTMPYPDKNVFQTAYQNLIDRIRNLYHGVNIFCLCGPMIEEPCLSYIKEVVKLDQDKKRDKDVFFIEIPRSIMTDNDWGCDMHPNMRGMIKIANIIADEIKARMYW